MGISDRSVFEDVSENRLEPLCTEPYGLSCGRRRVGGRVRHQLERVSAPAYLEELVGTIGADPFHGRA
jgi:hypothetical protein